VQALALAHQVGRRPDAEILRQYREQTEAVEERIRKLRAMLATLSTELETGRRLPLANRIDAYALRSSSAQSSRTTSAR
jgi:hypothetical protein